MKNSSRDYSVLVRWDADSGGYVASCLEIQACIGSSTNPASALAQAYGAVNEHLAYRRKRGLGVPVPFPRSFAGRILVRGSGALHKELSERAALEGVSLNQFVCCTLERAVSRDDSMLCIERRVADLLSRYELTLKAYADAPEGRRHRASKPATGNATRNGAGRRVPTRQQTRQGATTPRGR